ncbi:DUF3597 domain-containing protein [Stutzerimonas azotifigens]|uniref:DUF3597 domain-containing protein n=1 Tax=Stutzerimonas azotifigens TaxID=291995 RepID=UPI000400360E|nr:DUF3597 domain-containing protein [Stutzerimonas azotifigens]
MGLFSKIKEKLGIGSPAVGNEATAKAAPPAPGADSATSLTDRPTATSNATTGPLETPAGVTPVPSAAPERVDVAAKLDAMAGQHPETLNWRTSIVDLLKLLGIDSSLESRKELATELGCPPDKMGDSAQMNMWLHREVLKQLSENGGQVPPELLH